MDDDKLQDLLSRLDGNLQDFYAKWAGMSPAELIEASREITAIRDTHDYLTETHGFEPEEVEFLLQSENPLKIVADQWCERMGDMSDFCFALDEVFKGLEPHDAPQAERPSVLGKLRNKAAEVKSHLPDTARAAGKEAR